MSEPIQRDLIGEIVDNNHRNCHGNHAVNAVTYINPSYWQVYWWHAVYYSGTRPPTLISPKKSLIYYSQLEVHIQNSQISIDAHAWIIFKIWNSRHLSVTVNVSKNSIHNRSENLNWGKFVLLITEKRKHYTFLDFELDLSQTTYIHTHLSQIFKLNFLYF